MKEKDISASIQAARLRLLICGLLVACSCGSNGLGTLTAHDAGNTGGSGGVMATGGNGRNSGAGGSGGASSTRDSTDRKSTRLNSSHRCISYAVFCLKK